jgi:hypothetical protein
VGRTGTASLPLHGGRVPIWLASRMARLGRVLTEALVLEYGRDELLRRLAHPFWFQCLGSVMGMDWHSSGITTSVLGALKRALAPVQDELGIYVCGGRGRHSRETPGELRALGERLGLDADALVRASRLVAKVARAAVQDGYQIYLHGFIVTSGGQWSALQVGLYEGARTARRYHWLSEGLGSFVEEPHTGIDGAPSGEIVNLTDRRAAKARAAEVELARQPGVVLRELQRFRTPHLSLPAHHEVTAADVNLKRLAGTLAAAAERGPADFPELLLTPGVGARTVEALALVAPVLHGSHSRNNEPPRYSNAHAGKDAHPFPVPLDVYDRTLGVLRHAVEQARLGNDERLQALRRLDAEARRLEATSSLTATEFEALLARERDVSADYRGRSVAGSARKTPPARGQLSLDFAGPSRSSPGSPSGSPARLAASGSSSRTPPR